MLNSSLLLLLQVILYTRCSTVLKPFKYAGFPLLLKVRVSRVASSTRTPMSPSLAHTPELSRKRCSPTLHSRIVKGTPRRYTRQRFVNVGRGGSSIE